MQSKQQSQTEITFETMKLKPALLKAIYALGFEKPTTTQSAVLYPFLLGRDIIAQSQSGSGKTAIFVIGIIQKLNPKWNTCQAVILCPTSDLAIQTKRVVEDLSKFIPEITSHLCIGGTDIVQDAKILRNGIHIAVGTPGRIKSLIEMEALKGEHVRALIIDEADQLILHRNLKKEVESIRNLLKNTQKAAFSATFPEVAIKFLTQQFKNPFMYIHPTSQVAVKSINQYKVQLDSEEQKMDVLEDFYSSFLEKAHSIIFCSTKERAQYVADELLSRNPLLGISFVHGELSQDERHKRVNLFRTGATKVLVSTDILCRGIDIQQVSVVINYDMPYTYENYIHAIGRGGRFGRKGTAITFAVTAKDNSTLSSISEYFSIDIPILTISAFENVC